MMSYFDGIATILKKPANMVTSSIGTWAEDTARRPSLIRTVRTTPSTSHQSIVPGSNGILPLQQAQNAENELESSRSVVIDAAESRQRDGKRREQVDETLDSRSKDGRERNVASDANHFQHSNSRRQVGMGERGGYTRAVEVGETHVFRPQQDGSQLIRELRKKVQHYKRDKDEVMSTTNVIIGKLEDAEHRNQDLEIQVRRLSEELHGVAGQLRQAETFRQQTLELLEAKTLELKGAQMFLSKEDSLSGADVLAMVTSLNAEILQVAAFMADSLENLERCHGGDVEIPDVTGVKLGEDIVRALKPRQQRLKFDPMSVQIALQVSLAKACKEMVESWIPGYPYDQIICPIYSRIRGTGAVAYFVCKAC
jgi:hypothetical protein